VHLLRLQDGGVLSEELAYPKIMSTHYFSEVDSAYPTQLGGNFQTVVVAASARTPPDSSPAVESEEDHWNLEYD